MIAEPDPAVRRVGDPADRDLLPLTVTVLVGSTRPGRIGPVVASWFVNRLERRTELDLTCIDLAGIHLPDPDHSRKVAEADAVVVVTPEYNHSYPGPLKAAIDSLKQEWYAKPIGFVSYGGISGGLRAVEALRVVFAELHAITVRETVSIAYPWERLRHDGTLEETPGMATAADRMLQQLAWWAQGVRLVRAKVPYLA